MYEFMIFVGGFLGATLCKGLNRGIGTLLAGSLAFFIEFIAQESGQVFHAIFIGTIVFVVGMHLLYSPFTCFHITSSTASNDVGHVLMQ